MKTTTMSFAIVAAFVWQASYSDTFAAVSSLIVKLVQSDLAGFLEEHKQLYRAAELDGNYSSGVIHYYSVMAPLLTAGVGKTWQFIPDRRGVSQDQKNSEFQGMIAKELGLRPNQTLCEIGCGFCRTGRGVAWHTGSRFVGLTMSPTEVELGRAELEKSRRMDNASIIQGDYLQMPFADGTCDAVLAVYTLKYSHPDSKLLDAFGEIARVLRPGGRFASYEILNSDKYDPQNATHAKWSYHISYNTHMPPLASLQHFRQAPSRFGLTLKVEREVSFEKAFEVHESHPFNTYYPVIFGGDVILRITRAVEWLGIKPGLTDFMENFCLHPVIDLYESIREGTTAASTLFVYEKA